MKRNKLIATLIVFVLMISIISCYGLDNSHIYDYDNNIYTSTTELENIQTEFPITVNKIQTDNDKFTIVYKLFNIFTVKRVQAKVLDPQKVFLGGMPIGVSIGSNGLIIANISSIITLNGSVSPATQAGLKVGDEILSINDNQISSTEQFINEINNSNGNYIKLSIKRNGTIEQINIKPHKDLLTGKYMLGISVRDGVSGIGTMTYIKDDNRYGALGHPISEVGTSEDINKGTIYTCEIYGAIKGEKGKPGELKGYYNSSNEIGSVDKNTNYGIFGNIEKTIPSDMETIELGGIATAKPGKALIYTTVDNNGRQPYAIEIVKTEYQKYPDNKGMIIHVTDEKLLEKTGGIVQGMSGSPIVQDGKLVGAVSHVFINDPTRGYGMYIDWMINN